MSPAELPKITVVTPSFNQARYLPETMDSILGQNYPRLEYIVMDGGSTDGSREIIEERADRLAYWQCQPDKGQTNAINQGFERATGDILCWVNSDDTLFPGSLERVGRRFVERGRPELITGDTVYMDGEGRIRRFCRLPRQSRFFFYRGVWCVAAPSVFFSASVYRAIGSLREDYRLSMDFDMWVRMMNTGARVEHIPEYLGGFRWHDESKSTVSVKKMRGHRWNSERAEIMKRHMSGISYRKCQFWRTVYKWLQVANLNYARGWLECRPHKGRVWSEVFK